MQYICGGFLGRGCQTTVGLSKTVIFIILTAICLETLDRIYRICMIYIPSMFFQ